MIPYLLRRLLLIPPTLFAILALNFCVVQLAPGGPVQALLQHARQNAQTGAGPALGLTRGGAVLSPAMRAELDHQFGFDQPPLTRFYAMLRGDLTFNLGTSFATGEPVARMIAQRLPVSLSLGLWSTLLAYLAAIPLGLAKAVKHGSRFDALTSLAILAGFAIPSFLLALLLVLLLGAGGVWPVFPLRGLTSAAAATWPWPARLADYAWHLALPLLAMTTGGLATLTLLTKNAVLEELSKLYVTTARAKGLAEWRVLARHVLPNAMLLLVAGFPAALTAILFTSALLIEIVFGLHGLGELGYAAILSRDYPVMFGTLYVYTLISLVSRLLGDLLIAILDPRIDFAARF